MSRGHVGLPFRLLAITAADPPTPLELAGPTDGTLPAGEYHEFLTAAWPQTQRLIKGQLNAADE